MAREERGPFREDLLHPALAEITLAGGDKPFDFVRRPALADRDELDFCGLATGDSRRPGDRIEHALAPLRSAHREISGI
jgi:hypothetical protein